MPPPLLRLDSSVARGQVSSLDERQAQEIAERRDEAIAGTGFSDGTDAGNERMTARCDHSDGRRGRSGSGSGSGGDSLTNSFVISDEGTLRLGGNNSVQYDISRQGLASRNKRRGSGGSTGNDNGTNGGATGRRSSRDRRSSKDGCGEDGGDEEGHGKNDDVIGNVCAQDVMLSGVLGTGASSVVMRGISRRRHTMMAVKTVKVTDRERRQQLMSDLRALTSIGTTTTASDDREDGVESGGASRRPCVPVILGLVRFHGAYYEVDTNRLSICLEHMDYGSLADVLRRLNRKSKSNESSPRRHRSSSGERGVSHSGAGEAPNASSAAPGSDAVGFPEHVVRRIARDVLLGLQHLHSHHVVHRDIKPPNILLNSMGHAKITDFGISAGLAHTQELCATWVGTVLYMSPERIESRGYSYSADIWSLGLTLMETATGRYPYGTSDGPLVLMLNVLEDPPPCLDGYSDMTVDLKALLNACLKKGPEERASASELLSMDFIGPARTGAQRMHVSGHGDDDEGDGREALREFLRESIPCQDIIDNMGELLAVHTYRTLTGAVDREDGGEKATFGPGSRVYEFLRKSSIVTISEGGADDGIIYVGGGDGDVLVYSGADEIVCNIDLFRRRRGFLVSSANAHGSSSSSSKTLNFRVTRVVRNEIGSFDISVESAISHDRSQPSGAEDGAEEDARRDDDGMRFEDRICLCPCSNDPNSYWLKSIRLVDKSM